jgi:hypothetical protein
LTHNNNYTFYVPKAYITVLPPPPPQRYIRNNPPIHPSIPTVRWEGEGEGSSAPPPPRLLLYLHSTKLLAKIMYLKLPMYLFFTWSLYLMILKRAHPLLGPVLGPNDTRLAHCHFRTQISLDIQGPPLPIALIMDFARLKIFTYRTI